MDKSFWQYARQQGGDDAVRELEEAARAEEQAEKNRKVDQLRQFSLLNEEELIASLEENDWDVDAATLSCFAKHEERKQEEQAEVRRRGNEQRRREARATAEAEFAAMFTNVTLEERSAVLDKHDGDYAAALDELLQMAYAHNTEAEPRMAEGKRQDTLNALTGLYPDRTDIKELLERHDWDLNAVLTFVQREQALQMMRDVQPLCPSLTIEELFQLYTSDEVHSDNAVFRRKAVIMHNQRKKRNAKDLATAAVARAAAAGAAAPPATSPASPAPPPPAPAAAAPAPLAPEECNRQLQAQIDQHPAAFEETVRVAVDRAQADVLPLTEALLDATTAVVFNTAQADPVPAEPPKTPVAADVVAADAVKVEAGPVTPTAALTLADGDTPTTIKVSWNVSAAVSTSDYISLAVVGTASSEQVAYKYNEASTATGAVVFELPPHCGEYEFRYHHKTSLFGSATVLGTSRAIHVGPKFTFTAARAPAAEGAVAAPNKIVVSFEQQDGEAFANAWVGMYPSSNSAHKDYITWNWCRARSGQLSFDAPKMGTFYFRLFTDRTYVMAAETSVTLEARDELSIVHNTKGETFVTCTLYTRDPTKDNVWVGVYKCGEANNRHYRRQHRVSALGESTFVFKTPIHEGLYEARLLCNGYEYIMSSASRIKCDDNTQWFGGAKSQ